MKIAHTRRTLITRTHKGVVERAVAQPELQRRAD